MELKDSHHSNLDTFDSKFEQIHNQMEQVNAENLQLKDKLKKTKE